MNYYCNQTVFFTKNQVYTFNQFMTTFPAETVIYIDKYFHSIFEGESTQEIPLLKNQQTIIFNPTKRNYHQEFLSFVDFSLYTTTITLKELMQFLLKFNYVRKEELLIYRQFSSKYNIESGRIFGVPLVFYAKNDVDHHHSLFLVDYLKPQTWTQLYCKVRLAQEVKKNLMLIIIENDEIKEWKIIKNM